MHDYKITVEILLEEISTEQRFHKFSNPPPKPNPLETPTKNHY